MKKWKLSNKDKEKLVEEFKSSLDDYGLNSDDLVISFEKEMDEKPKEKLTIFFTPLAYLRSEMLVRTHKGEVGWHGLMKKLDEKTYLVYNIIVYPQTVNGARTLDPTKDNAWYDKYEDVLDEMRFQAHSHVDMATTPSTTDISNQRNVVKKTITGGYMLFQIWNKKGDINSFFYDIDNNLLYDREDIDVEILDEQCGSVSKFIEESKEWVEDMIRPPVLPSSPRIEAEKTLPAQTENTGFGYRWKAPAFWRKEETNYRPDEEW